MKQTEPLIRNISDTARWAAVYRARESERNDALFHDPFAKRLAGERGEQIARSILFSEKNSWSWVTRTVLFDRFIEEQIRAGVDTVINIAAGLDARPYRMSLPASLKWVEVDLTEILSYKEEILANEKPGCQLERVKLDVSEKNARRELFDEWDKKTKSVLIITEGLIIYLTAEEVGSLADDLSARRSFHYWLTDLVSPGLLRMLQKKMGKEVSRAGAPFKFGPDQGPEFFTQHGWKPKEIRSMLKEAAQLKRLPLMLRLVSMIPEKPGPQGSKPWSGACLFENIVH